MAMILVPSTELLKFPSDVIRHPGVGVLVGIDTIGVCHHANAFLVLKAGEGGVEALPAVDHLVPMLPVELALDLGPIAAVASSMVTLIVMVVVEVSVIAASFEVAERPRSPPPPRPPRLNPPPPQSPWDVAFAEGWNPTASSSVIMRRRVSIVGNWE
jgi:hypothetical protein